MEGKRRVRLTEADRRKPSVHVPVILIPIGDQEDKKENCGQAFFFVQFYRELINCPGIINWLNCLQQLISGNVAPSANSTGWDNINITRAGSALQYLPSAVSSFLVQCFQVKLLQLHVFLLLCISSFYIFVFDWHLFGFNNSAWIHWDSIGLFYRCVFKKSFLIKMLSGTA